MPTERPADHAPIEELSSQEVAEVGGGHGVPSRAMGQLMSASVPQPPPYIPEDPKER